MKHTYFSISDASKKLNVESHVLRYWEEELNLNIPRNEQGHRYYDDDHMATFKYISELRDDGYSLNEIRSILSGENTQKILPEKANFKPKLNNINVSEEDERLEKFRQIMGSIIGQAMENNNERLATIISDNTSERILKEMNYLFRTFDEDEDVRIRQLEAAINAAVSTKKEIALSKSPGRKKHKLFKNKKE